MYAVPLRFIHNLKDARVAIQALCSTLESSKWYRILNKYLICVFHGGKVQKDWCGVYKSVRLFEKLEENMFFLTNEQANKAEITILSARDATRPGFQAGVSWVAV